MGSKQIKLIFNLNESNEKTIQNLSKISKNEKYKDIFILKGKSVEIKFDKERVQEKLELIIFFLNILPANYPNLILNQLNSIFKLCKKEFKENYTENISYFWTYMKNMKETNTDIEYYYSISSMITAFVGDSIGAFLEFQNPHEDNYLKIWKGLTLWRTPKGQLTDDSEMALSLLWSIADHHKLDDIKKNYIAQYYGIWIHSNPFDIGNTTINALGSLMEAFSSKETDFKIWNENSNLFSNNCEDNSIFRNSESLSNGFLMRHTPLSFYLYQVYKNHENQGLKELYYLFDDKNSLDVRLTHSNSDCLALANLYDLMIFNIIKSHLEETEFVKISDIVYNKITQFILKSNIFNEYSFYENLEKFIGELNDDSSNSHSFIISQRIGVENIGYVLHSIKLCLYSLKKFELFTQDDGQTNAKSPFERIMFLICNLGGDTDTNACIVGGVLGALLGLEEVKGSYNYLGDTLNFLPFIDPTERNRDIIYTPGISLFLADHIYNKFKTNKDNKSMY